MELNVDSKESKDSSDWRKLYPFTGHHLILPGGHAYHYLDEGEGDETVIMLHGNPTWSFYYRNLIQTLRKKYRVIVPDHLGCGLSSKPQKYSYCLKNHIQNIDTLVDSLGLKKYSMIVHDWGGPIGFGHAIKNPGNINKLVITNTAAFASMDIPWRIALCKAPLVGEWIIRGLNGFAWPATFMAVKKKMKAEVKSSYLLPYNNYQNRVAIHQFVRDIPLGPRHPSYSWLVQIEHNLSSLTHCPKLLLWGGKDFCFHQGFLSKWREVYPEAKVKLFPKAGHYVLEDAGNEANEEIENFLNS